MNVSSAIALLAVAVGAISGALEARDKRMDVFGAIVVALATALGGGTLRDLLLGHGPVFWIHDSAPVLVAVFAAMVTFVAAGTPRRSFKIGLMVADAGALALFTTVGAEKAVAAGVGPVTVVVMAVITGVAGGIFRDILCNEIPWILRRDIYATASLAGAVLYLTLTTNHLSGNVAGFCSISLVFVIRMAVLRWKIRLPEPLQAQTEVLEPPQIGDKRL